MVARSEVSRQAILEATLDLLGVKGATGTHVTVQRLTIEAISKRAGVSKSTIYRWWDSKAAVVLDAFLAEYLSHTVVREDLPFVDALQEHVRAVVSQYAGVDGTLVSQLIAESQYDDVTMTEFHRRFWDDRKEVVVQLVRRGMDEGKVDPSLDPAMVATLIYAPIYQRLLFRDGELDGDFAQLLVSMALSGVAPTAR